LLDHMFVSIFNPLSIFFVCTKVFVIGRKVKKLERSIRQKFTYN
jgi:hypothetical protein